VADLIDHLDRGYHPARHIMRILDLDQPGWRAIRTGHFDRLLDFTPAQDAVLGINGSRDTAGEPSHHRQLPVEDVRARFADHLLAVIRVQFDRNVVAHGARRHEYCGFLACYLSSPAFQPIDSWVLSINVIPDLGLSHGLPHSR